MPLTGKGGGMLCYREEKLCYREEKLCYREEKLCYREEKLCYREEKRKSCAIERKRGKAVL
jgi:hypothetical protein